MNSPSDEKVSKFLSFVLRHNPNAIELTLDEYGWANLDALITKANQTNQGPDLKRELIEHVVSTNDKNRFSISEDGQRIRANQGHSIAVDLQLKKAIPPEFLYHGTAKSFVDEILRQGLKSQQRQYVHLSKDIETATTVGRRYGSPVVLKVKARFMHEQGFKFYLSENSVWLMRNIQPTYLIML